MKEALLQCADVFSALALEGRDVVLGLLPPVLYVATCFSREVKGSNFHHPTRLSRFRWVGKRRSWIQGQIQGESGGLREGDLGAQGLC